MPQKTKPLKIIQNFKSLLGNLDLGVLMGLFNLDPVGLKLQRTMDPNLQLHINIGQSTRKNASSEGL